MSGRRRFLARGDRRALVGVFRHGAEIENVVAGHGRAPRRSAQPCHFGLERRRPDVERLGRVDLVVAEVVANDPGDVADRRAHGDSRDLAREQGAVELDLDPFRILIAAIVGVGLQRDPRCLAIPQGPRLRRRDDVGIAVVRQGEEFAAERTEGLERGYRDRRLDRHPHGLEALEEVDAVAIRPRRIERVRRGIGGVLEIDRRIGLGRIDDVDVGRHPPALADDHRRRQGVAAREHGDVGLRQLGSGQIAGRRPARNELADRPFERNLVADADLRSVAREDEDAIGSAVITVARGVLDIEAIEGDRRHHAGGGHGLADQRRDVARALNRHDRLGREGPRGQERPQQRQDGRHESRKSGHSSLHYSMPSTVEAGTTN
jgi:hypothetical protein